MLIEKLINYLRTTLKVGLAVEPWGEGARLPLFLQDNYICYQTEICGQKLLLMVDVGKEKYPPATIRKHLEQLQAKWRDEVVYVREQVTSYDRTRLIEYGIPFIVPGNQLYLPMLAIDLREYFRRDSNIVHRFSPATQALALHRIYQQNQIDSVPTTPTEMARVLGYSKMTMSRAYKEVEVALAEVFSSKMSNTSWMFELSGHELWRKLQPYWRSPINRRHYLLKNYFNPGLGYRAGLKALAAYSMLAEPAQEVFAVSQSAWKVLHQKHDIVVLDRPDPQTVEIEVWAYPPDLFAKEDLVDPLSLYLSLKDTNDERVEAALEDLLGGIMW